MIINFTQHKATEEQRAEGVVDYNEALQMYVEYLEETGGDTEDFLTRMPSTLEDILTFEELPYDLEPLHRARQLANIAKLLDQNSEQPIQVMIGGAPFLMAPLQEELLRNGIQPVYAFSRRESVEEVQEDGSVRKSSVFKHIGFVYGL